MRIELTKKLSKETIEKLFVFVESFPILNPQYFIEWNEVFHNMGIRYEYLITYEDNEIMGFLPFAVKTTQYGSVIHSSPYIGYGGPVAKDKHIKSELIINLIKYAKKESFLTVTISTPPFIKDDDIELYKQSMGVNYQLANFYQYTLLDKHPINKFRSKKRSAFRKNINITANEGFVIKYENDLNVFNEWVQVLYERYNEIGAKPYPKDFFDSLYSEIIVKEKAMLVTAFNKDELIGGIIFICGKGIVDYFSPAFKSKYNKYNLTTFVLNDCFNFFIENNFTLFNWQSSPAKEGVYYFKARWGALESNHYYLTTVTGDISEILQLPLSRVREKFQNFFILPFSLWEK